MTVKYRTGEEDEEGKEEVGVERTWGRGKTEKEKEEEHLVVLDDDFNTYVWPFTVGSTSKVMLRLI